MPENAKRELQFGLLIAAIAFMVYANSLGNGYVGDDTSVIVNNPVLKGNVLSLFSNIDTTSDTQLTPYYRPVTLLTFLVEGRIHGFNPFFGRLLNVLLHSTNVFLFYYFSRSLLKEQYAALLASLLFALHPLHTEGVDYNAGGRNTMLVCFFVLMAYLFQRRSIIRNNVLTAGIGGLCFLAGLFSKETALMVFPFIAALEFTAYRENLTGSRLKPLLRLTPYVAAILCYLAMRWMTLSKLGIQTSIIPGFGTKTINSMYLTTSFSERMLDNIYIIPRYLLTIIRPTALCQVYVVPEDLNLLALPLFIGWAVIFFLLGWFFTKGRSYTTLFGLSWLIAFWLPVSGLVYFPSAPLADRYFYVPALGAWLIIADQAARVLPVGITFRRYATLAVALILVLFAVLTFRRNLDWKNDMTLFSRVVEQYPDNVRGHAGLGEAYFAESRKDKRYLGKAEKEFEKALAIDPASQIVHTPMGHTKLDKGDFEGALHHYTQSLAIFPYDKEARVNRAITYEKMGRQKEALADYLFFLTTPGANYLAGSRQHAEERVRELSRSTDPINQ